MENHKASGIGELSIKSKGEVIVVDTHHTVDVPKSEDVGTGEPEGEKRVRKEEGRKEGNREGGNSNAIGQATEGA